MPSTDTREQIAEIVLQIVVDCGGVLNRVGDYERMYADRILALAAPPVSAAGENDVTDMLRGDLLRRVMRAALGATVHDLEGIKLVRVIVAVAQQLAQEPDFVAALARPAAGSFVDLVKRAFPIVSVAPDKDAGQETGRTEWLRDARAALQGQATDEAPARPAAVEAHEFASGVLSDVVRALWTLDGFSHTNGNSVAEDILDYATLRNCPAAGSAERDLLAVLEDRCWTLRSIDEPSGGGDFYVAWDVVEHHMAEPYDRVIATADTPRAAILAALRGQGEGMMV